MIKFLLTLLFPIFSFANIFQVEVTNPDGDKFVGTFDSSKRDYQDWLNQNIADGSFGVRNRSQLTIVQTDITSQRDEAKQKRDQRRDNALEAAQILRAYDDDPTPGNWQGTNVMIHALIKFVRETNPDVFEKEIADPGGVSRGKNDF